MIEYGISRHLDDAFPAGPPKVLRRFMVEHIGYKNTLFTITDRTCHSTVVTIDAVTHMVSFSQPPAWFGVEKIRFTAIDTEYKSLVSNEVTLQVQGVDNAPVLDFIPDITVDETDLVQITPNATDLDGDPITYTFTLPLDSQGKWQTDYDDAGIYNVTVTAKDPTNLIDTQDVKINVRNVNRPPTLDPIPDITEDEGN